MERPWDHKPNVEISPNCPRCGSSKTKFCYYNNYSLTQPRYFCKGCRRYWTKGGSLRNVPVGGGCRRHRRGKSAVRLSTDGVKVNANFIESPSSSSLMQQQDGSHIDLALVYANFLNQPRETKLAGSFELPELPDIDPSMELNSYMVSKNLETRVQLPEENVNNNGLPGTLIFSDLSSSQSQSDQIYYNVFDSVHNKNNIYQNGIIKSNQVLPPLPSEEILWMNSQMMMNQSLQSAPTATEDPNLGPDLQTQYPNNLLFGNWSPFDFSTDDSFSKT